MKSKTLVIFGVGTYILSVISSAEDLGGNYTAPVALIAVSAIAMLVFTIMATVRLWKTQRISAILFLASSVITLVYASAPIKIINFFLFIWVVSLLWAIGKRESKVIDTLKNSYGLTSEESSTILEEKQKGNEKSVEKILATAQERAKTKYKEVTGVDAKDIIPDIGKEISWADIVNHAFRVLEFDRNNTTVDKNNQVKAKSSLQPYGYLLAESPILNNKVRIPIIHRDDFLLAASVFDEPKLSAMIVDEELLVTYAPKHLLPKGLSGSPHHVLHYAITPRGTLDSYYSKNNDMYMAKPDPQKLFGHFAYQGEIKVQINPEPEF
ncbi:MAG: hypothetical protein Q8O88_00330 [bacterium]|nr:hypothetical protein [bacterium]